MTSYNILGLSGALRDGSTNTKLLHEAARLFDGAIYTAADLNLPLYDGDSEERAGVPAGVTKLADQIAAADAVIISTPEYNKGPSGVLKNALDWVSRVETNPWQGKPVALMSAAAGRTGGEHAVFVLRGFMQPFNTRMIQGPNLNVAANYEAFDEDGQLTSEIYQRNLSTLMASLKAEVDRGR